MGLFSKRPIIQKALLGPVETTISVAGVSFYQKAIGKRVGNASFRLEHEPRNAHDSNAVRVVLDGEKLIGHLHRDDATVFAPMIDHMNAQNMTVWVEGDIREGDAVERFVVLNVPRGATIRSQLEQWQ